MDLTTSISATKISSFLNHFDDYGISIDEVIQQSGINPLSLSSPDNRLSGNDAQKVIETAVKLTNNVNLGLHQGEGLSKVFSNILGYILLNCSNLMECWTKYCKYEKIIDGTSTSFLNIIEKNAVISTITLDESLKANRQFSDFKIAGILSYVKMLSGHSLPLLEVHFTHSKPKDISIYQQLFNCNIYFEKPTNALIFNSYYLTIPVIEPNKKLLMQFEKTAQEILEPINNNNTYTNMVTEVALGEIIRCNSPSIKFIANKLTLSVRNLQLNLQNEGTTYTKLLIELKKQIAEKYLKDRNISVDEIAFSLGFSETSAFHRAFKSWTGLTPIQFRKSAQNLFI